MIGREFGLDQLDAARRRPLRGRLLEAAGRSARGACHRGAAGDRGRYQFTHALIQATLADELSRTRRARLHARIAEALEALYGAEADAHAAELAHHFAEAQTRAGPDKLVHYSALAGESALAAHAPEQALAHFQRALAAKGDAAIDDETAALLFGLGRAQLATLGPPSSSRRSTSLRRAFDYYVEAGDIGRAVAVAAHPLPLSLRFGYTDARRADRARLDARPPDSREEGRLLAQHGWFSGFIEADYEEAQRRASDGRCRSRSARTTRPSSGGRSQTPPSSTRSISAGTDCLATGAAGDRARAASRRSAAPRSPPAERSSGR